MIKGYCFTNLDEFKFAKWPTVFCAVPRVGERVESKEHRNLRVVAVTHLVNREGAPLICVELHQ